MGPRETCRACPRQSRACRDGNCTDRCAPAPPRSIVQGRLALAILTPATRSALAAYRIATYADHSICNKWNAEI